MSNNRQVRRRNRLFAQHPFCAQCGVRLVDPRSLLSHDGTLPRKPPLNMATLEHDRSRLHPGRWEPCRSGPRTRLLCFDCNQHNSIRDQERLQDLLPVFSSMHNMARHERRIAMRQLVRQAA